MIGVHSFHCSESKIDLKNLVKFHDEFKFGLQKCFGLTKLVKILIFLSEKITK